MKVNKYLNKKELLNDIEIGVLDKEMVLSISSSKTEPFPILATDNFDSVTRMQYSLCRVELNKLFKSNTAKYRDIELLFEKYSLKVPHFILAMIEDTINFDTYVTCNFNNDAFELLPIDKYTY